MAERAFHVTINSAQVQHLLSRLSADLRPHVIRRSLNITAADIEAEIKTRMSGRTLSVRSGTYRRSIKMVPAKIIGGRMQASVESDVKERKGFENLLEHGGTVTPKKRRFLTIPIPGGSALTASGRKRPSVGALTASGRKRFDAPTALRAGAFFVSAMASRTKGGFQRNRLSGGLIAKSKGKRLIPLFALTRHVTIRPHPIWGPVAESSRLLAGLTLERVLAQKIAELDSQAGR